jgi:hypothetical protein
VGDVALEVPLGLLPIGGRAQGDNPAAPRIERVGDGLDGPALAGRIAAFEEQEKLLAGLLDPVLHLHQLEMQFREFVVVDAALELVVVLGHGTFSGC